MIEYLPKHYEMCLMWMYKDYSPNALQERSCQLQVFPATIPWRNTPPHRNGKGQGQGQGQRQRQGQERWQGSWTRRGQQEMKHFVSSDRTSTFKNSRISPKKNRCLNFHQQLCFKTLISPTICLVPAQHFVGISSTFLHLTSKIIRDFNRFHPHDRSAETKSPGPKQNPATLYHALSS